MRSKNPAFFEARPARDKYIDKADVRVIILCSASGPGLMVGWVPSPQPSDVTRGDAMNIKRKLSVGLGFLFVIIIALVLFSSYYIQKLSRESDNILKNNYDSIVYSRNMMVALDDMMASINLELYNPQPGGGGSGYRSGLFRSGRAEFEKNLGLERGNITELHEKEYADTLANLYELFVPLCLKLQAGRGGKQAYAAEIVPLYEKLRYTLVGINDLNMQAVVRKNGVTKKDSRSIVISMALIGAACIMLAFAYFWYFPFYISNSMAFLSGRMKPLVEKEGMTLEIKSDDEFYAMLQSVNLLENRLAGKQKGRRAKRA